MHSLISEERRTAIQLLSSTFDLREVGEHCVKTVPATKARVALVKAIAGAILVQVRIDLESELWGIL